MTFIDLIIFVLASVGLTLILVDSTIFHPVRVWIRKKNYQWLNDMISCYQCMGFWSGLFCGILMLLPGYFIVPRLLLLGFLASYLSMLGTLLIDYYNAVIYVPEPKDDEEDEDG